MPDERRERTDYQGLLALMLAPHDAENWSYPYWNIKQLDGALQGLALAPRDGVVHVTAPTVMPTATLSTSGGVLPAGQDLEIVQTWVDDYGRETLAGPVAALNTGTPIADPLVAPTFGAFTPSGTGFEGGLLEVWFSWTDGSGGETLPSPVAGTDVPYLSGGLLSEVVVDLPSTAAAAGAAGANIYARHRSGNVVLAYQILVDSVSQVTLTGVARDCYRMLPLANSTFASRSVNVTGQAANAGETPALTRFYLRPLAASWVAGDRRLKLSGLDEWDPDTVTYPLLYTGATGEIAPGFPPTVSQVKSIRPLDLATEIIGILSEALVDAALARDAEVAAMLGGPYVATGLVTTAQGVPDLSVQVSAGWAVSDTRLWNPGAALAVGVEAAHGTLARVDSVCISASGAIVSSAEDAGCKGTPDAAPVAPPTPTGYVLLATVSVPALDTTIGAGQITDAREIRSTFREFVDSVLGHEADSSVHFTGTEKVARLLSSTDLTDLTDSGATTLHYHTGATVSETNTGTDLTLGVTPDGLAASYAGTKSMSIIVFAQATDVVVGDAVITFPIPPALNGMNLVNANAIANVAGTTNATTIGVRNVTDSQEMLSTAISIASGDTVGTPGVVNAALDDVVTNDVLRIDIEGQCTTPAKGLMVTLEFRLP